jgi:hypothetical protein
MGTIDDETRALARLDDASAEIRAFTRRGWVDDSAALDLPTGADAWKADVLVKVCCSVAQRALENPGGLTQSSLGSYSESIANASSDVYLTAAERRDLEAVIGKGGVWALPTTRGCDDGIETIECVNAVSGHEAGTIPFTYEPLEP